MKIAITFKVRHTDGLQQITLERPATKSAAEWVKGFLDAQGTFLETKETRTHHASFVRMDAIDVFAFEVLS